MANQKLASAPKQTIDARKFLASINKGYGGQLSLVESKLDRLGRELDTTLRLVSHNHNSIMFEDADANTYYRADISRTNRSFQFENIQQLVITDQEKPEIFEAACKDLINCIEESMLEGGSTDAADRIFSRMVTGHCSPYAVPYSGVAATRDGGTHRISAAASVIPESAFPEVVNCLKEAVKSSTVTISEGTMIVGEESVKLPISELTRKQVVARKMRSVAENAYRSGNFRRLMKNVAAHVSNHEMKEAIKLSKDFFAEEQEFCLLDKDGMVTLVENSMYSQGVWNYHLVKNTAMLLWEANCHINKKDIVEQWETAANKSTNKALVENVSILKDASTKSPKAFSDTYDAFLNQVFTEDYSTRTVKAQAYLNMLKMLNNVVDGSDADAAVKGTVDDLIIRIESDLSNVDDATLFEVEDLLANVSADLIHDTATLSNFDTIPEPPSVDTFGSEQDMVGEFEGDMSEPAGGDLGGLGDMDGEGAEGDLGEIGGEEASLEGEGEEAEEEELQLAHVVRDAKPIAEMTSEDIKVVLEALKGMKPEQVEVDDEFKAKLKKGLTESEVTFIKQVMDHSKGIDADLFEGIASAYYDLVIAEDITDAPVVENDTYEFGGDDVAVNEEYDGLGDDDDDETMGDATDDDAVEEGVSANRNREDIKDRRTYRNFGKGKGSSGGSNRAASDNVGGDSVDESKNMNHKKNLEGDREGDRDGDYDDNNLDESIAVVAQNDEALLQIIDKVLEKGGHGEGDEEEFGGDEIPDDGHFSNDDDEKASDIVDKDDDGVQDDEGELIMDKDHDNTHDGSDMSHEADPDQDKDDQAMKEDNNITEPPKSEYDSEEAADKDGHGRKINPKPTFSDKDYDGSSGATTAKSKPSAGHPNPGKGKA